MLNKSVDDYREAIEFPAPYLIEKLVTEGYVRSTDRAIALFREVKRYIVLCELTNQSWEMYSTCVDEAWHQFLLYSREYTDWCNRFIGHFVHHAPNNAPSYTSAPEGEAPSTFLDFAARYQAAFG